jgi:co-chaperonin GroES (HSP10)
MAFQVPYCRVAGREIPRGERREGSIILPEETIDEHVLTVEVTHVGPGRYENGVWVKPQVAVGARVLISRMNLVCDPILVPGVDAHRVCIFESHLVLAVLDAPEPIASGA